MKLKATPKVSPIVSVVKITKMLSTPPSEQISSSDISHPLYFRKDISNIRETELLSYWLKLIGSIVLLISMRSFFTTKSRFKGASLILLRCCHSRGTSTITQKKNSNSYSLCLSSFNKNSPKKKTLWRQQNRQEIQREKWLQWACCFRRRRQRKGTAAIVCERRK